MSVNATARGLGLPEGTARSGTLECVTDRFRSPRFIGRAADLA